MKKVDVVVFLTQYNVVIRLTIPGNITKEEQNLCGLLLQGRTISDIAQFRNRSIKTISTQKKRLYQKLGVKNDISFWRDVFFKFKMDISSVK
ncbi:response regulator transcription factor [Salmonella enterica subsp. enterica serovar Montevideo]|nr:response regulator transcription factor [Salmonella enterica subsp. enterica serovar Montevideo]EEK7814365.1 response regulator transcription factor [Salmonella enterica subsp. enterica serovar Montevideo]